MKRGSAGRVLLSVWLGCMAAAGCAPGPEAALPSAAPSMPVSTAVYEQPFYVHAAVAQPDESGMDAAAEASDGYACGLFSWDEACLTGTRRAKLYMMIRALGITELYQAFPEDELNREETYDFVHDLMLMGVDCYYLDGNRWWGADAEGKDMIACVEAVAAYNEKYPKAPMAGIHYDVETFLLDEWDEAPAAMMELLVSAHRKAYEAAQAENLRVIACLPVWYDETGLSDGMLAIIRDACDEVSLMNYNRGREIERIEREVAYAQEYGKPVTCIFEFQRPGVHGLTEDDTYYNAGIGAAVERFEMLYDSFGYDQMKFAYHYLHPLLDMMDA